MPVHTQSFDKKFTHHGYSVKSLGDLTGRYPHSRDEYRLSVCLSLLLTLSLTLTPPPHTHTPKEMFRIVFLSIFSIKAFILSKCSVCFFF